MKKIKIFTKLNANQKYKFIVSDITNLSESEVVDLIKLNKVSFAIRQQIFSSELVLDFIKFFQMNGIPISKAYKLFLINGHESDAFVIELEDGNTIQINTTTVSFFEEDKGIENLIVQFFEEIYNK